jgi:hypothetical protein
VTEGVAQRCSPLLGGAAAATEIRGSLGGRETCKVYWAVIVAPPASRLTMVAQSPET